MREGRETGFLSISLRGRSPKRRRPLLSCRIERKREGGVRGPLKEKEKEGKTLSLFRRKKVRKEKPLSHSSDGQPFQEERGKRREALHYNLFFSN